MYKIVLACALIVYTNAVVLPAPAYTGQPAYPYLFPASAAYSALPYQNVAPIAPTTLPAAPFRAALSPVPASYTGQPAYPYSLPVPAAYSALPYQTVAPIGPTALPAAPFRTVFPTVPAAASVTPIVRAAPVPAAPVFRAAPFTAPVVPPFAGAPLAAAPLAVAPAATAKIDYADAYPQYQYAYNVHDTLTGDSKAQEEIREGGIVKGRYSLIDADGSRRTVNYYADPLNGFNAIVQKDLPIVAAPVAPLVKTAPTIVSV